MYLIFDCETTGLYVPSMPPPRLVQLAWQLHDNVGRLDAHDMRLVRPEGFDIPFKAAEIHGITTERALKEGQALSEVIDAFDAALQRATCLVGHNVAYDMNIIADEYAVLKRQKPFTKLPKLDTMWKSRVYTALPSKKGKNKPPKLTELYEKLFEKGFPAAHDASFDVAATAACHFELLKKKITSSPIQGEVDPASIAYQAPKFFITTPPTAGTEGHTPTPQAPLSLPTKQDTSAPHTKLSFAHLHVHSQHSIIPATLSVQDIVQLSKKHGLSAVALTDMGTLCGAFSFVKAAKEAGILPIVGCECFFSEKRKQHKFTRDAPDRMYRQPLLARNETGYKNLCKLSSLGYVEGLYGLYPRIDKPLLRAHKEGLIALSGGIHGELPQLILHQGKQQAADALTYWMDTFGEHFYLELLRHGNKENAYIEEEKHVNEILLAWAKTYNLAVIPAQEVFYAEEDDADAHDTLLCIKEQLLKSAPIGKGRGKRHPLVEEKHHFCTPEEMYARFSDIPEAFTHLDNLLKTISSYDLARKVLLPDFPLPKGFTDENSYLTHLVRKGAKERYHVLTPEIEKRLTHELQVISEAHYAGYFLIIHEIVFQARKMEVAVGPGRGSVAGALIAYVLGLTQVDPLVYGLLFERFLNPERISMPDVDIDFDDENRERLIRWILQQYGSDRVAQIATYGTMAARSAIRDCARVLEMPLHEADNLAKQVPLQVGYTLKEAFAKEPLKSLRSGNTLTATVLEQAEILEGVVRHVGTHACGLIIAPKPLIDMVPLMYTHDAHLPVTQYDNSVVEDAGLLKMDFLGLRTLSILRSACTEIERHHKEKIDLSVIPLDDKKTYALFQQGQTAGIFQFESSGMQRYLRLLQPDKFEDLIAMNALYRPGPMEYIAPFISRKNGREAIDYDVPEMEPILSETYGITVYQEQVMQLSERLAGFSKSQADTLRYAMGKKKRAILDKLKPQFLEGFNARGHPEALGEKIWKDWGAFASYAFNKSHATCYSLLAYQAAYLRANFPEAYFAAVLTHHQGQVEKTAFFIEVCRALGIWVLPPNVCTSKMVFSVHAKQEITFGLASIKGVGQGAALAIAEEREKNGVYTDIFDFATRLPLDTVNKRAYEALAQAGAFDAFPGGHRRQYLEAPAGEKNGIEKALKWSQRVQVAQASAQEMLFDSNILPKDTRVTALPAIDPYNKHEILALEQEAIGVYVSGHPLDDMKWLMPQVCNVELQALNELENLTLHRVYRLMGHVLTYDERKSKNGHTYGQAHLEDYSGRYTCMLWRDAYMRYGKKFLPNTQVYLEGRVETRSFGKQRLSFEISRVYAVPDELSKLLHSITLQIPAATWQDGYADELEKNLQEAPTGYCSVYIQLTDGDIKVRMRVKKYTITPDAALLLRLRALNGLDIQLSVTPHG